MHAIFQRNTAKDHGRKQDAPLSATMELNPSGGAICLQRDQHIYFRDAAGWMVRARSGTVWITQDGDSRDIVLKSGQSFVMDRNGVALLTPLDKADICVSYTPAADNTRSQAAGRQVVSMQASAA